MALLENEITVSSAFASRRVAGSNLQLGKVGLNEKTRELRARGVQIMDFSGYVIERPYGCVQSPPEVVAAAVEKAMRSGWPAPELRGISTLRDAIAEVEESKGIQVDPKSEVIVTGGGAMQGLYNVLQATLNPGDEAIIFAPGLSLDEQVKLAEGVPVFVQLREEDGYRLDAESVERAISPRTKLIILNTPHNPTGHVASREELEQIADIVTRHKDILVVSDEIIWKWVYDRHEHISFASLPGMKDRTVTVSGVTKSGMFDWRIGWVVANANFIDRLEKIMFWQNEFSPPILQVAAEAHLSKLDEWIGPIVRDQQTKRDTMYDGLIKAGFGCVKPQGHLTSFPNISRLESSSVKFAEFLLDEAHVLVSPGLAYLGEGHLRIGSNRTSEEIKEGLEKMTAATQKYKA